jgi:hypothetical protein
LSFCARNAVKTVAQNVSPQAIKQIFTNNQLMSEENEQFMLDAINKSNNLKDTPINELALGGKTEQLYYLIDNRRPGSEKLEKAQRQLKEVETKIGNTEDGSEKEKLTEIRDVLKNNIEYYKKVKSQSFKRLSWSEQALIKHLYNAQEIENVARDVRERIINNQQMIQKEQSLKAEGKLVQTETRPIDRKDLISQVLNAPELTCEQKTGTIAIIFQEGDSNTKEAVANTLRDELNNGNERAAYIMAKLYEDAPDVFVDVVGSGNIGETNFKGIDGSDLQQQGPLLDSTYPEMLKLLKKIKTNKTPDQLVEHIVDTATEDPKLAALLTRTRPDMTKPLSEALTKQIKALGDNPDLSDSETFNLLCVGAATGDESLRKTATKALTGKDAATAEDVCKEIVGSDNLTLDQRVTAVQVLSAAKDDNNEFLATAISEMSNNDGAYIMGRLHEEDNACAFDGVLKALKPDQARSLYKSMKQIEVGKLKPSTFPYVMQRLARKAGSEPNVYIPAESSLGNIIPVPNQNTTTNQSVSPKDNTSSHGQFIKGAKGIDAPTDNKQKAINNPAKLKEDFEVANQKQTAAIINELGVAPDSLAYESLCLCAEYGVNKAGNLIPGVKDSMTKINEQLVIKLDQSGLSEIAANNKSNLNQLLTKLQNDNKEKPAVTFIKEVSKAGKMSYLNSNTLTAFVGNQKMQQLYKTKLDDKRKIEIINASPKESRYGLRDILGVKQSVVAQYTSLTEQIREHAA